MESAETVMGRLPMLEVGARLASVDTALGALLHPRPFLDNLCWAPGASGGNSAPFAVQSGGAADDGLNTGRAA